MLEARQQCREEKLDEFLSFFSDRNRLRYYVGMMLDRYPPMCGEALGHVPHHSVAAKALLLGVALATWNPKNAWRTTISKETIRLALGAMSRGDC
jgi:hypothetical protein